MKQLGTALSTACRTCRRGIERWALRTAVSASERLAGWWHSGFPPGVLPAVEYYLQETHRGKRMRCLDVACFASQGGEQTVFCKLQVESLLKTEVECWLIRVDSEGAIRSALKAIES